MPLAGTAVACYAQVVARSSSDLELDPMLGRLIAGKFRLTGLIADGGMGRIYLASHVPLNVEICVKTLHPELRSDTAIVKRFLREAQAASRVRHPNCVQVIDYGET